MPSTLSSLSFTHLIYSHVTLRVRCLETLVRGQDLPWPGNPDYTKTSRIQFFAIVDVQTVLAGQPMPHIPSVATRFGALPRAGCSGGDDFVVADS